jgi:hypothetical protein
MGLVVGGRGEQRESAGDDGVTEGTVTFHSCCVNVEQVGRDACPFRTLAYS